MKQVVARWISIVGHPFLVVPLAIAIAGSTSALVATLVVMAVLGIYVLRRFGKGELSNVDISEREKRPTAYLVAIAGMAIAAFALRGNAPVFRGLVVATALFVVMAVVNLRLKASLHSAFAVLAAGIAWPSHAALAFAVAAPLIAWARVAYGRHERAEVAAGLALGAAAAVALVSWSTFA